MAAELTPVGDGRLIYRVVEVQPVFAEDVSAAINELASQGWELDRVDYVKELGVRRPQMAFVVMKRVAATVEEGSGE